MERGSIVEKLIELAPLVLTWIVAVVGVASFAARTIAPLTKTTVDDKLAGFFSKLKGILDKLALNNKVE